MKRILPIAILTVALSGCYIPRNYELQPTEKITFQSQERANEFRRLSGNDMNRTGSVVEITKPTTVSCE